MSTSTRRPKWLTVFIDVSSYIGGWALIAYQALAVPPKDVNEWFLLLGGSLIGVPGVAEILAWKARNGTIGTETPGSSPPPAPLQDSVSG